MSRQERSAVSSLLYSANYDAQTGAYSVSLSYDKISYHVTIESLCRYFLGYLLTIGTFIIEQWAINKCWEHLTRKGDK